MLWLRGGQGDLGQVRQRRNVAGLVEAQQQRQPSLPPARWPARRRGRRPQRAAPGRSDSAAGTPLRRRSGTASRAHRAGGRAVICEERPPRDDPPEPVRPQQRLDGGLDRAPGPVRLRLECAHGVVRRIGVGQLRLAAGLAGRAGQRLVQVAPALPIGPAHDRVDSRAGSGGRVQQRRQPLLGRDAPEITALDPSLLDLARRGQPPCDLECPVPGARANAAATRCRRWL